MPPHDDHRHDHDDHGHDHDNDHDHDHDHDDHDHDHHHGHGHHHRHHHQRPAALVHGAGATRISVGVIVARVLVMLPGVRGIHPLASILIVLVSVWGTWDLLREAIAVALDAAARSVGVTKLGADPGGRPGVED